MNTKGRLAQGNGAGISGGAHEGRVSQKRREGTPCLGVCEREYEYEYECECECKYECEANTNANANANTNTNANANANTHTNTSASPRILTEC